MQEFISYIRESCLWLHHILIEYHIIYLDLWSIIHFFSGVIVFSGLSALKVKRRWMWLLIGISLFEVVEMTLLIALLNMFEPEVTADIVVDLVMGMLGGYFVYTIFEKSKLPMKWKKYLVKVLTAFIASWYWTGYYGYTMNVSFLNTEDLNLFMFINLIIFGIIIIDFHKFLKKYIQRVGLRITLVYMLFYFVLLLVHFISDQLFNIRDIQHEYWSFIFSFIKVNISMLGMYVLYPIILIQLNKWFEQLLVRVINYSTNMKNIYLDQIGNERIE